jgi:hypothetical protein
MTAFVRQSGMIRMPYSEIRIRHNGRTKNRNDVDAEDSQRTDGLPSSRLGFQRVNECLQSRRHLAPAWIVEKKPNRAWRPVL